MSVGGREPNNRVVIKVGTGALENVSAIARDIAVLQGRGTRVVLVHGGRDAIDQVAFELGNAPRHATSRTGVEARRTDALALDALHLALSGRVKPRLVHALVSAGVKAVGLTGLDGGCVRGRRRSAIRVRENGVERIVRDDLSGTIVGVDPALLVTLTAAGFVPVISPPIDGGREDGPLNADADRLAAAAAVSVNARSLAFLFQAPGLLTIAEEESTVVEVLSARGLEEFGGATGRMKHKVAAARYAIAHGVNRVYFGDARVAEPVTGALAGRGTTVIGHA